MEGLTADLIPQPSTTTGTTGSNFNYPSDVTYVSDASVYTGSFVPDCHALYLLLVDRIELPCRAFRNGSVQEFYRLKTLITLEQVIKNKTQVITSVVEKKNNLNQQPSW